MLGAQVGQQCGSRGGGNVPVLIHAPFRKNDNFAATQDFSGKKRQQARMIVGNSADTPEQFGEAVATFKQPVMGNAAAIGAGSLVNKVLRNYSFETSEMVELENLAIFDQAVRGMDRHVHAHTAAQQRECPHAPLIERFVNLHFGAAAHRAHLPPPIARSTGSFSPST